MTDIRDRLAQVAAGDNGNTALILTSPLDRKTTTSPPRTPTRRIPTTTESGLPAAPRSSNPARPQPLSRDYPSQHPGPRPGPADPWQVTQHSQPVFSGFDQQPNAPRPQRHVVLAASVFLVFVVLAAIAITLIALLR
jgi:non-specific serine/threonine protein kinase